MGPKPTRNTKAQWELNGGGSSTKKREGFLKKKKPKKGREIKRKTNCVAFFGLPGKRRESNGLGLSIQKGGHGSGQIGVSRLLPPRRGGVRGGDAVAVGFRPERHLLQPHHHLLQDLLPVSPPTQTPTASAYRSLCFARFRPGNLGDLRGPRRHGQPSVTKRAVQIPSSSQSSSCFAWRRLWVYIVNRMDFADGWGAN